MIHVTRINHLPLVLNSDLIEHIESAPDTIITLTNGQKLVVLEPVDEVIRRVVAFRRLVLGGPEGCHASLDLAGNGSPARCEASDPAGENPHG